LICIPAYNEAKNIGKVVKKAKNYASEVLVYDDGSVDNTSEEAKAAGATVIRNAKSKGYGVGIKTLFEAAREKNDVLMVTLDSDGQHDPDDIPRIIEPIMSGRADIVIGSRFLNAYDKHKVPSFRSLGIKAITKVTQSASYNNITDAQSGFRAYSRQALTKINLFEQGMAVSTEILLRAKERNLLIEEVPIIISYNVEKPSTQNPISHGIGVLYSVIQFISLRHPLAFYGLPGIAFVIIAVLFMNFALSAYFLSKQSLTGSLLATASMEYIVISVGFGIVGIVLLATGTILYTITALLKGKIKEN
jgi:glycosyltransferase involved in cell wall biosynthesis